MLRNFGWIVPNRVAGMARPRSGAADELRHLGVAAVVSLTEDPPLPELAAAGLAVLHEPVADFAPPSAEALARCVAFLKEGIAAGRAAVVHCHAGYGRTGTVLAAYLVATGSDAAVAIATVRRLRPGSIETPEQEDAVRRFAARAREEDR
jgi:atypical dual specificity phosphatase